MYLPVWLSFVGASFVFGFIPGPSVCFTIAHAIRHGARRTLPTIGGQIAANCCQIIVVLFGLNRILEQADVLFQVLKVIGALYLVYLGYRQWTAGRPLLDTGKRTFAATGRRAYIDGFVVCGTNPKAILYYAAFLPQFVVRALDEKIQLTLLAMTSIVIAATVLIVYTVLADRVSLWFDSRKYWKMQNRLAGFIMISAGIGLSVVSVK
ncbi:MAG: LysE family translocator [candidate division WOR-3 bacterium]|nr:MAG: LysE family translocator [candidate division WOR-3 bacterium]